MCHSYRYFSRRKENKNSSSFVGKKSHEMCMRSGQKGQAPSQCAQSRPSSQMKNTPPLQILLRQTYPSQCPGICWLHGIKQSYYLFGSNKTISMLPSQNDKPSQRLQQQDNTNPFLGYLKDEQPFEINGNKGI